MNIFNLFPLSFVSTQIDDHEGLRPLYRHRTWQTDERRDAKKRNKNNWSTKGGKIAPIFVPPTPISELAIHLRRIAEAEAECGVDFKIIKTGGKTKI